MKKKMIVAMTGVYLLMLGCQGSQANRTAFLEEYIAVTDEIIRIVDANPTPDGVKQAQSYLDTKKGSLKSKFEAGKKESPDKEMERKFSVIVSGQIAKVAKLPEKHPNVKDGLDKLNKDFGEFLL